MKKFEVLLLTITLILTLSACNGSDIIEGTVSGASSSESTFIGSRQSVSNSQPPAPDPLTLSQESQILTDWLKTAYGEQVVYDGTNARIALYLGTYGDSVIVVIDDVFRGAKEVRPMDVSGLKFEYGNRIRVWRNGEIKHLMGAFETGWISAENMRTIHALTLANKLPRAMLIEELPIEIEERMKAEFRRLNSLSDDEYVWIRNYLGTYSGNVAVVMDGPFSYPTATTGETVAGVVFGYANLGPDINIWHDGGFYRLQQAYDLSLITQNDLKAIQQRWNRR